MPALKKKTMASVRCYIQQQICNGHWLLSNAVSGAFFRLYTRDKPTEFRLEPNIDSLKASSFDGGKKTVIVIHGYQGEKSDVLELCIWWI